MKRHYTRWTIESIIEAATPYKTRTQFATGAPRAYRAAVKAGAIDLLYPIIKVVIDPSRMRVIATRVIGPKPIDESKRGLAREEADEIIYRWHRHLPLFIEEINRAITQK